MAKLEKLRTIEIDILDEFVRICNKYDFKYYLAYGTLIGAVRHQGFIPWDDDIDVWMFRDDYDKFASIAQTELDSKYFYQDYKTDPEYPYNFAKIRMNGTRFVQIAIDHLDMNHGIYIDIFPLDSARNNKRIEKIDWVYNKFLRTIASIVFMDKNRSGVKRSLIQRFIISICKFFVSKKRIHVLIDKEERKLNLKNTDKVIYRSDEHCISFNKTLFEVEQMEYEGKVYSVPKGYDLILKASYGDYMQLPPEEQRTSNHESLDVDFGNYFDEK